MEVVKRLKEAANSIDVAWDLVADDSCYLAREKLDEVANDLRSMSYEMKRQWPVAVALQFKGEDRICLSTVFDTMEEAQDYANQVSNGAVLVSLYTNAQPVEQAIKEARSKAIDDCINTAAMHGCTVHMEAHLRQLKDEK